MLPAPADQSLAGPAVILVKSPFTSFSHFATLDDMLKKILPLHPLRPGDNLRFVAIKQIAAALGIHPEELIRHSR